MKKTGNKTEVSREQLVDLVNQGLDNNEICRILNCHIKYVNTLLKEHSVSRSKIFNTNRGKSTYFHYTDKVELTDKGTEFFDVYQESDIDLVLFK